MRLDPDFSLFPVEKDGAGIIWVNPTRNRGRRDLLTTRREYFVGK